MQLSVLGGLSALLAESGFGPANHRKIPRFSPSICAVHSRRRSDPLALRGVTLARPRPVHPGRTYMITRRCSERRFFLKPSTFVEHIFTYCLAVAAARFGILLHACTVMSNHHHLVLTDVHGNLPRFCHLLHSLAARMLNRCYGRFEHFWDPASYSRVELVNPEDVLDKMAYTLANPVAAGLVEKGVDWPGFITTPKMLLGKRSQSISIDRPEGFFVEDTDMPESIELQFCCPPMLEEAMGKEKAAEELQRLRMIHEKVAREKVAELGIPFLGRGGVYGQDPFSRPHTYEKRFQLSPSIGCRDAQRREELIQRNEEWLEQYEVARARFWLGEREVLFPEGTWGPAVLFGALVEGGGPPVTPPELPPPLAA